MAEPTTNRISREKRGQTLLIGLNRSDQRNAFDPDLLDDPAHLTGVIIMKEPS